MSEHTDAMVIENLRLAHAEMHRYLESIGESGCEFCEAIGRLAEARFYGKMEPYDEFKLPT